MTRASNRGTCRCNGSSRNEEDIREWSTGVMTKIIVPSVQTVQAVQPPLDPPPGRGGGNRWGLERSVAVEPSEVIERIERFSRNSLLQYSCTPILHCAA